MRIIQYYVRNIKKHKDTHKIHTVTAKHIALLSLVAVFSIVFLQSCQDTAYCVLPSGDNTYKAPKGMLVDCDTLEATYYNDAIHLNSFQYKLGVSESERSILKVGEDGNPADLEDLSATKTNFRLKVSEPPNDVKNVTIEYSTVFITPLVGTEGTIVLDEKKVTMINGSETKTDTTGSGFVYPNFGLSGSKDVFNGLADGTPIELHITAVKKGAIVGTVQEPDVVLSRLFSLTISRPEDENQTPQ